MNRIAFQLAMTAISASTLIGCASEAYHPEATDTQLSAYAGKAAYPYSVQPELAPHLFTVLSPDGTITIYNAGDETYTDFEIWVNKTYTLHVANKLDSRSKIVIAPNTLFNNTGSSMGGAPATGITSVQMYNKDKLWDVQGPILPH